MRIFHVMSVFFLVLVVASVGYSQEKFAYINSQRILQEYQEAIDVQNKLDELRNQYQSEYELKVREYQQMIEEVESQSLLLSEEKKQEKMRELQQRELEINQYRYDKLGPEGEFYQKNRELTEPLYDKINAVIDKIARAEEYDFIFDSNVGLLFAKQKYDITDRILEELNKGGTTGQN